MVAGGNNSFSHSLYITQDVTDDVKSAMGTAASSTFVLAAEGQSPMGDIRWDAWDPAGRTVTSQPAGLLVQLVIVRADGSRCTVVSDGSWEAAPVDGYYNPIPNSVVWYDQVVENTDARNEPVGWQTAATGFEPRWSSAVTVDLPFGSLRPIMARPIQTWTLPSRPLKPAATPRPPPPPSKLEPPPPPTPPPVAGVECVVMNAIFHDPRVSAMLGCQAAGEVITEVTFAAYGAPIGTCRTGFAINSSCNVPDALAVTEGACLGKRECSIQVADDRFPLPEGSKCPAGPTSRHRFAAKVVCGKPRGGPSLVVDFVQEFQGGLVLSTQAGVAGQRVKIVAGELLGVHTPGQGDYTGEAVSQSWGYEFTWTLRDGPQTITQHNYMVFRYAELTFLDAPPPADLAVSAWGTWQLRHRFGPFLTHSLTHSPTHPLTHSLTHSRLARCTCSVAWHSTRAVRILFLVAMFI